MKNILLLFILISSAPFLYGQNLSSNDSNRKVFVKQKGLQLAYVSLTGGFVLNGQNLDNGFLITIAPRYVYYFSSKIEGLTEYAATIVKFGSLSPVRSEVYHQFAFCGRYFPFDKFRILYGESGIQAGTYSLSKINKDILKEWSTNMLFGIGLEMLPGKKKYVLDFNIRYAHPLNSNFQFDYLRMLGFGIVLKK